RRVELVEGERQLRQLPDVAIVREGDGGYPLDTVVQQHGRLGSTNDGRGEIRRDEADAGGRVHPGAPVERRREPKAVLVAVAQGQLDDLAFEAEAPILAVYRIDLWRCRGRWGRGPSATSGQHQRRRNSQQRERRDSSHSSDTSCLSLKWPPG